MVRSLRQDRGHIGGPDENGLSDPELSPDGGRVVANRTAEGNQDVWIIDATRTTRLTFDPSSDHMAIWSPDGNRIAFDSTRRGPHDLYWKAVGGGGGSDELVAELPLNKIAYDWSRDGRFLVVQQRRSQNDLRSLGDAGRRRP